MDLGGLSRFHPAAAEPAEKRSALVADVEPRDTASHKKQRTSSDRLASSPAADARMMLDFASLAHEAAAAAPTSAARELLDAARVASTPGAEPPSVPENIPAFLRAGSVPQAPRSVRAAPATDALNTRAARLVREFENACKKPPGQIRDDAHAALAAIVHPRIDGVTRVKLSVLLCNKLLAANLGFTKPDLTRLHEATRSLLQSESRRAAHSQTSVVWEAGLANSLLVSLESAHDWTPERNGELALSVVRSITDEKNPVDARIGVLNNYLSTRSATRKIELTGTQQQHVIQAAMQLLQYSGRETLNPTHMMQRTAQHRLFMQLTDPQILSELQLTAPQNLALCHAAVGLLSDTTQPVIQRVEGLQRLISMPQARFSHDMLNVMVCTLHELDPHLNTNALAKTELLTRVCALVHGSPNVLYGLQSSFLVEGALPVLRNINVPAGRRLALGAKICELFAQKKLDMSSLELDGIIAGVTPLLAASSGLTNVYRAISATFLSQAITAAHTPLETHLAARFLDTTMGIFACAQPSAVHTNLVIRLNQAILHGKLACTVEQYPKLVRRGRTVIRPQSNLYATFARSIVEMATRIQE